MGRSPHPFRPAGRRTPVAAALLLGGALLLSAPSVPRAAAPCMLANPSFEIPGSGGDAFGGWGQYGVVDSSGVAAHGLVAARTTGPGAPGGASGLWQELGTLPGESWEATVRVRPLSAAPLTGASQAVVAIEWRDAGGNLLGSEMHAAADASTPPDRFASFAVTSAPAPSGAAAVRLRIEVVQASGESAPGVLWDELTLWSVGPPTLDDLQWTQYPGGRVLSFAGRDWRVKGPGVYGPGPSAFCDSSACTWVDVQGVLHLTVQDIGGAWSSTQVAAADPLGYGDYVVATRGRLDLLDPNVVFAMFLYQSGPCYDPATFWWNPFNEVDIELSRWGVPGNDLAQYAVQPSATSGNKVRFDATFSDDEVTSHAFRWLPDRVEFRSWRGAPDEEATSPRIQAWTYQGPHLPRPERTRVRFNLWQFQGVAPATPQEVILEDFVFVPAASGPTSAPAAGAPAGSGLLPAWPNPGRPPATIRFSLARAGEAEVAVYDVTGRLVRLLRRAPTGAGLHEVRWNGMDDRGRPASSGVYFYRLRAPGISETRRLVLLR